MALPGLVAYGSGEDSDADESGAHARAPPPPPISPLPLNGTSHPVFEVRPATLSVAVCEGVHRLGSGPVLVGGAQDEPDAPSASPADPSSIVIVPGANAAPGSQTGPGPGPAGSMRETSAAEQGAPAGGTGDAEPAEAEAASAAAPEAEDGADGLAGLPLELQRPPDTAQDPELEVSSCSQVRYFGL